MHWWNDHTIKIRLVEIGDDYWFIMGADSRRPDTKKYFYKIVPQSANYERFKKGHQGSAYMRFGIYTRDIKKVKDDAICDCGHRKDDHDENNACLYEVCDRTKFDTFQVACRFLELLEKQNKAGKEASPSFMKTGDAGLIRFQPTKPLAIEQMDKFPELSRFAIRDMGKTVAAGVCIKIDKK